MGERPVACKKEMKLFSRCQTGRKIIDHRCLTLLAVSGKDVTSSLTCFVAFIFFIILVLMKEDRAVASGKGNIRTAVS